jgi:kynureninase
MITAADTTWRYIQSGHPTKATLFFSEDLRRASGEVVPGSLWVEGDDPFTEAFPPLVLAREFELHTNAMEIAP